MNDHTLNIKLYPQALKQESPCMQHNKHWSHEIAVNSVLIEWKYTHIK